jgi:hypothetical protein
MTDETNKEFSPATDKGSMSRSRCILVLAIVMLGMLAVPAASAGSSDDRIILTVGSDAIAVPGRVLTPGKYVMRFFAMQRKVVEISTLDGRPVGFFSVVPSMPLARIDEVQLDLSRPSQGGPERLTGFVNPNLNVGYEFVYPQSKAKPSGRFATKTSQF